MPPSMDLLLSRIGSPSEKLNLILDLVQESPIGGAPATISLDTLRLCFQLLESARAQAPASEVDPDVQSADAQVAVFTKLCSLTLELILHGKGDDGDVVRDLSEFCSANAETSTWILERIEHQLLRMVLALGKSEDLETKVPVDDFVRRYLLGGDDAGGDERAFQSTGADTRGTIRCLEFLKCYFETSSAHQAAIPARLISSVLALLVAEQDLASSAAGALSALMPRIEKAEITNPTRKLEPEIFFSEQMWDMISKLLAEASFETGSIIFRLWFQWIYQSGRFGPQPSYLQDDKYWTMLQSGLLWGFTEQRKYCLGILQLSLAKADSNILTPHMSLRLDDRHIHEVQYEKYCTLFEAIVLNRYTNQVQACLGDLGSLIAKSHVHITWITMLLSAGLQPKIQDGIRKIIGTWYFGYVNAHEGPLSGQSDFVIDGLLPWATQGFLFTNSMRTWWTRTSCGHGTALSGVIENFTIEMSSKEERRRFVRSIFRFILDKKGRIFPYSTLYLLEGLLRGLNATSSFDCLEAEDFDLVLQLSRQVGLSEVARDLCIILCGSFLDKAEISLLESLPGYYLFLERKRALDDPNTSPTQSLKLQQDLEQLVQQGLSPVEAFNKHLQDTNYRSIQGTAVVEACDYLLKCMDADTTTVSPQDLHHALEAIWDETDIQEYPRYLVRLIPPLFFHLRCVEACCKEDGQGPLCELLSKVLGELHTLAEGRSYILAALAASIRNACCVYPDAISNLPIEEFLVRFTEVPPSPKDEFLFEVLAAQKLSTYLPHRTYASYFGKREWHAYASVIDLINRFPKQQIDVGKRVLGRLIRPWGKQKAPVPIISKWKQGFQLQIMLLLVESCVDNSNVDSYLKQLWHALTVESWPRYRYLLEWIIGRIYMRFPERAKMDLLPNLSNVGDGVPRLIASYIKLSVMATSFSDDPEAFALTLMTHLIPLSASPKVQIRFEAHWSVPIVWDLADEKGWKIITENPAFSALNEHIRSLDKFNSPAFSTRGVKLDLVKDHNLTNIFQGEYMRMDHPEPERVSYREFVDQFNEDQENGFTPPTARTPLGEEPPKRAEFINPKPAPDENFIFSVDRSTDATPLQTKSGILPASLIPSPTSTKRPTTLIVVASLIDNPTNLGGLSRISEIFGVEALYLRSLDVLNHKDFQATAVTSHKHLPIHPLAVPSIPDWLTEKKREGYTVICIEQTDRSFVLGEDCEVSSDGVVGKGRLPRKCVLVLGSEREGVGKEVLVCADRCVEIRQVGVTRSLNVQTAGGIVVWEWWREWGREIRGTRE